MNGLMLIMERGIALKQFRTLREQISGFFREFARPFLRLFAIWLHWGATERQASVEKTLGNAET